MCAVSGINVDSATVLAILGRTQQPGWCGSYIKGQVSLIRRLKRRLESYGVRRQSTCHL